MIPLHRPAPELPASRPLPVATDAPTDILTETLPPGLIPPVTLPPPADERRVPATLKGTVWSELQLPAWVAKVTFQVPSKAPGLAIAACAPEGADIATAPKTAAAKMDRKALGRRKLVKVAIDWADMDMFSLFWLGSARHQPIRLILRFRGSSLPIGFGSAISPDFIARLIKGCRVDVRAGYGNSEITEHFQRSNEHFSRESALWAHFSVAYRRAKCPS